MMMNSVRESDIIEVVRYMFFKPLRITNWIAEAELFILEQK